jgi:hypothetical protein
MQRHMTVFAWIQVRYPDVRTTLFCVVGSGATWQRAQRY